MKKLVEFAVMKHAQLSIIAVVMMRPDYQTRSPDFRVDFAGEPDENGGVHLEMRPRGINHVSHEGS
jgi:hypothetical protein